MTKLAKFERDRQNEPLTILTYFVSKQQKETTLKGLNEMQIIMATSTSHYQIGDMNQF